jgi:basic endochitinase B
MKWCLILFFSMTTLLVDANTPLTHISNAFKSKQIKKIISKKDWNLLFPNRFGCGMEFKNKNTKDFYSYDAFIKSCSYFPEFMNGNDSTNSRELCAFLANIAQETSGGWEEAPGGYFKWGLHFVEEIQADSNRNLYADYSKPLFPPVKGVSYRGRGPKQISWNYNYAQFSEAWYGSKDTLLNHPERLAKDAVLSFASALWFWMTPQYPKPSCHDVISGKWIPDEKDREKGRTAGFGATVNIINGGVECGQGKDLQKTEYRYKYYLYFCNYFKINPGNNIECTNQTPFGR